MNNFLYILLGIIFILLLLRLMVKIRIWTKKGRVAPPVGGQLGKYIQKGEMVMAYFYNPTCHACKTQEKYFPRIQERFQNIIRINVAKDRDTAMAFGVMGTPTTIIIENGKIKDYFVGIAQPNKVFKSLNE